MELKNTMKININYVYKKAGRIKRPAIQETNYPN